MAYNVRKDKAPWTDEENAYCLEYLNQWRNCPSKKEQDQVIVIMQASNKINSIHDLAWHMNYLDKLTNGELNKGEYAQKDEQYVNICKK